METTETLDGWRTEVLSALTDHRIVDRQWLDAWIWLWLHSYGDLVQYEAVLYGANFRESDGYWLLVVKLYVAEVPHVVFVSSADPTRCVQKFRKLLRSGECSFYKDKFA